MRRVLAVAGLLGLAVSLSPAAASAAPRHAKRCANLEGRELVRNEAARVVAIRYTTRDGRVTRHRDLLGCALPNGPVRTLDRGFTYDSDGGVTTREASLVKSAGRFVLLRRYDGAEGGRSVGFRVTDVSTGYGYRVSQASSEDGGTPAPANPQLNAAGQLVAILANPTGADELVTITSPPVGTAQVVAFNGAKPRHVLDTAPAGQLPASALRLEGSVARWTRAGQPRSRDLSALPREPSPDSVAQLGCVGRVQDGCDAGNGLEGTDELAVSPDGRNVYVAANSGEWGAILSFRRNPATGRLDQLPGLEGCTSFDGRAGSSDAEARTCRELGAAGRATDVDVSADGRTVYTVGAEQEVLGVWRRDPATGVLTQLECWSPTGAHGCRRAPFIEPDKAEVLPGLTAPGRSLAVGGGSLSTFRIGRDGRLSKGRCLLRFGRYTSGARRACRTARTYAKRIRITSLAGADGSDGPHLFAVADAFDLFGSASRLVRFDLTYAGKLRRTRCTRSGRSPRRCRAMRSLGIPNDLAVATRGRDGVYAAGYDFVVTDEENGAGFLRSSGISAFTAPLRQLAGRGGCALFAGRADRRCASRPAAQGPGFRFASAVGVTRSGRHVLAGFRGAVAILKRNARTQRLTALPGATACVAEGEPSATGCARGRGLGDPEGFAFSRDGRFAYMTTGAGVATLRLGA